MNRPPPPRRQRAEAAGGFEQRGGLQLAAPQVALDRHVRRVSVLALQQLARGEGGARVRERAQLSRILVVRELRKRAREQQIAGGNRSLAASSSSHSWAPPAQLRAIDHVVVHERRRMNELYRDRRADQALLPRIVIVERGIALSRRGG